MKIGALAGAAVLLPVLAAAAAPAGDVRRGETAYQKCYACHAIAPGKNDLSGPTLHAIVGRRIAAAPGFAYSPALLALAAQQRRWDATLLERFTASPHDIAPGTAMTFPGMRSPQERADLIAYLRTLRATR